ncbi:MAG: heme-binding protein, partial [Deltaproteobacteria bacterium]|nr:heme-binding protein [Deltaproteobacteria bacterium]
IRRVPARVVAVRRYSGRITEANYQANREKLLASLRAARVATTGKPWEAVYDGPYTLPFRRRNEVLVEIVR